MENILKQCNNFNDIYSLTAKLETKQKGDIFELLTKLLFIIHPNYNRNTKNIWLYNDIPTAIIKKFKLPKKDKGIDLLLETTDNKYYAIQSKYRSDPYDTINWTNLSTFVGQLFVNNFEQAIYVTNTYSIEKELTKSNKISFIFGDFFKDLYKDFFDNIRSYLEKKQIVYTKRTERPHQKEAINKTLEYFKDNNRGYLSMACGTGKTFTTYKIDYELKNKLTLILVPSLYLLSQIYKEYCYEYVNDKNIDFLLCGSDVEDDDTNIPFLSTNSEEIKSKLENLKNKVIIISTYQSCDKLKLALENKEVDLIIFDEAHKTVNNNIFSLAIFDKNIKAKKRLFVTATPKIYKNLDEEYPEDENVSVSDDSDYDENIDINDSDYDDNMDDDNDIASDDLMNDFSDDNGEILDNLDIDFSDDDKALNDLDIDFSDDSKALNDLDIDFSDDNFMNNSEETVMNNKKEIEVKNKKEIKILDKIENKKEIKKFDKVENKKEIKKLDKIENKKEIKKLDKIENKKEIKISDKIENKKEIRKYDKNENKVKNFDDKDVKILEKIENKKEIKVSNKLDDKKKINISDKISDKIEIKKEIKILDKTTDKIIIKNEDNKNNTTNKTNIDADKKENINISMDNPDLYGNLIYEYQIGVAINDNVLTPYEIHLMCISDESIKAHIGKKVNYDNKDINFHYIAASIMIENMIKNGDISNLITYHSSIKNSKEFNKMLTERKLKSEHIDGSMSAKVKSKLISEFKNDTKRILTSSRVLNEGVNIEICDAIMFVESRNSSIDIVQCVGRALRLYNGKNIAKILIPILEEDIKESKFSDLVKIVKNLGNYDYHIKENMFDAKIGINKLIKIKVYGEKEYKAGEIIEINKLKDSIKSVVVGGCYKWENTLRQVSEYIDEHGKRPNCKSTQLGCWLADQQKFYKKIKGIMRNKKKYNKYTDFRNKHKEHFMSSEEIWEKKLNELDDHVDKYGKFPSKKTCNALYMWTCRQQYIYKNKIGIMKKSNIYDKYSKIVNKYKNVLETKSWHDNLRDLDDFINTHAKMPCKNTNKILYVWSYSQEFNYNKRIKTMKNPEIFDKYVKFRNKHKNFFASDEEKWNSNFEKVIEYVEKYENLPTQKTNNTLSSWVKYQLKNYEKRILIMKNKKIYDKFTDFKTRYKKLFTTNEEIWNKNFEQLIDYIKENDKLPSSKNAMSKDMLLTRWVNHQQVNYKKKINIMENFNIYNKYAKFREEYKKFFVSNEENWNNRLEQLIDYIKKYDKLPSKKTNNVLHMWIAQQNKNYKKKTQIMKNPEIYDKMTNFKNIYKKFFSSNEEKWNNKLEKLKNYIKMHKKLPSLMSEKKLHGWLNSQQHIYNKKLQIMKNLEIQKKFMSFKTEYSEYF